MSDDINFAIASMAGKIRNAVITKLIAPWRLENRIFLKYCMKRTVALLLDFNKILRRP